MCRLEFVPEPAQVLDELKESLDSLPQQVRDRLIREIRLVLSELSQEQDAFVSEIAS